MVRRDNVVYFPDACVAIKRILSCFNCTTSGYDVNITG